VIKNAALAVGAHRKSEDRIDCDIAEMVKLLPVPTTKLKFLYSEISGLKIV
jgi:hypothetical protein